VREVLTSVGTFYIKQHASREHQYERKPPRPCLGHAPAPVFASQTSSTTSAFGRHLSTQGVQKRLGPFPVSRGVGPKDVVVLEVPGRCSG
jgi:hypothetical protein